MRKNLRIGFHINTVRTKVRYPKLVRPWEHTTNHISLNLNVHIASIRGHAVQVHVPQIPQFAGRTMRILKIFMCNKYGLKTFGIIWFMVIYFMFFAIGDGKMGNGLNSNFHQKKQLRSDCWPTRTWCITKNTNEKDYNTKPAKRFPTRRHIDMLAANQVFHCVHQVCLHGGEHQTLGVITPDAQFKGAVVESNFVRFFESSPASGHKSPSGMQYFLKSCRSVRVSSNSRISRGPGSGASPIWNSKQIPKSFYSKKKEIALGQVQIDIFVFTAVSFLYSWIQAPFHQSFQETPERSKNSSAMNLPNSGV